MADPLLATSINRAEHGSYGLQLSFLIKLVNRKTGSASGTSFPPDAEASLDRRFLELVKKHLNTIMANHLKIPYAFISHIRQGHGIWLSPSIFNRAACQRAWTGFGRTYLFSVLKRVENMEAITDVRLEPLYGLGIAIARHHSNPSEGIRLEINQPEEKQQQSKDIRRRIRRCTWVAYDEPVLAHRYK